MNVAATSNETNKSGEAIVIEMQWHCIIRIGVTRHNSGQYETNVIRPVTVHPFVGGVGGGMLSRCSSADWAVDSDLGDKMLVGCT